MCCENCAVPRKLKLSDVDTIIYNQTITEKTIQETEGLIKATETHKKKNINESLKKVAHKLNT